MSKSKKTPAQNGDEMQPPDARLLASENRMLMSERLAGIAHALRGSGLPALAEIDDGADLPWHVAVLTGAYQMELANVYRREDEIVELRKSLADAESDIDEMKSSLDAHRETIAGLREFNKSVSAGKPAERNPLFWLAYANNDTQSEIANTEAEARRQAELLALQEGMGFVCAVIARCESRTVWQEAA